MTLLDASAPRRVTLDLPPADIDCLAQIVRCATHADAPLVAAKLAYSITVTHGPLSAVRFIDALQRPGDKLT